MIIQRKESFDEDDGKLGYVETIFESSNILMSTYFPKTKTLYLAFNYGQTYRYDNVDEELFREFETAESQGKLFNSKIKNNDKIPYQKAYKMFDSELEDAKTIIKEWKENNNKNPQ